MVSFLGIYIFLYFVGEENKLGMWLDFKLWVKDNVLVEWLEIWKMFDWKIVDKNNCGRLMWIEFVKWGKIFVFCKSVYLKLVLVEKDFFN